MEVLSCIPTESPFKDMCATFCLLSSPSCSYFLGAEIAQRITAAALNDVVSHGPYAGQFVVYAFAASENGSFLVANNFRLADMVTSESLNSIVA